MNRLDINDPECFNLWRKHYDTLTDFEHIKFYNDIAKKYPEQKSFTKENFDIFFNAYPITRVVEIGGWTGDLADYTLKKFKHINKWLDIELCDVAASRNICNDDRYVQRIVTKFRWFKTMRFDNYDALIASHFIEHLSNNDFDLFLNMIRYSHIPYVAFEAPIEVLKNSWNNYVGTHMLEYGWGAINIKMQNIGYNCYKLNNDFYMYNLS